MREKGAGGGVVKGGGVVFGVVRSSLGENPSGTRGVVGGESRGVDGGATTPPPLTTPPPAPTQPSKQSSPLSINLEPVELIFSTPPTSPQSFFYLLEDLPPRIANLPPPQPSFDSIERLASQPPLVPDALEMEPPLPPLPP
uniref:Uncharacterized protein n=1 Tax=Tanacetum cinerariifolium TaxID=118510 RepID=A0A6L2JH31_TANCI|nr:hypothetical protein [Tanacetum cinerariifolium]